eukprot:2166665-Alexandrium_andersonii.AAC.1
MFAVNIDLLSGLFHGQAFSLDAPPTTSVGTEVPDQPRAAPEILAAGRTDGTSIRDKGACFSANAMCSIAVHCKCPTG